MVQTNIIVKLQIDGVHCWPTCPLNDVSFLRDPHRHVFYIECRKAVTHDDRDVEIILFKNDIIEYLKTKYPPLPHGGIQFGSMSCEMIAKDLLKKFDLVYCSVLEDNENGAEIYK